MSQIWLWTYSLDPHYDGPTTTVRLRAESREDAIWRLYQTVLTRNGPYLEKNDPNTLGFYHLFHPAGFWNEEGFTSYSLDRIRSREHFIECFEKEITYWDNAVYNLQCLNEMLEIRVALSDEEAKVDQTRIV